MRTTAQAHRVVVRIKEAVLFRLILLFFIISLSACTANKEKGKLSFFKLFNTQQDEWLNLIPTEELKSINGQNRSDIDNHEKNNDDRAEQLRKKAQELSDYEF